MILTLKNNTIIIPFNSIVELQAINDDVLITLTRGIKEIEFATPNQAQVFVRAIQEMVVMGVSCVQLDVLKNHVECKNVETYLRQIGVPDTGGTVSCDSGEGLEENDNGHESLADTAGSFTGEVTVMGDDSGGEAGGSWSNFDSETPEQKDSEDSVLYPGFSFGILE